jgi:GTP:adenosylcobinamide-phosphate guanylyltransferase
MTIDVIITAGGNPAPSEPLFPYTQGNFKALLDVAGKPMIQWILDALNPSRLIGDIVIVGVPPETRLKSAKNITIMDTTGDMLENLRKGARTILAHNPTAKNALIISCDIPAITTEMIDWLVNTVQGIDYDIFFGIIDQKVMEERFPQSHRTYLKLKDNAYCGGDIHAIRLALAGQENELYPRLIAARKSPLKQVAMFGFDTLFLVLIRQMTLELAEKILKKRLGVVVKFQAFPYAEMGMDIDKPHQLELLQADIASRCSQV